jgi:hypothetical protein
MMAVATMPPKTDDELCESDKEAIARTYAVPDSDDAPNKSLEQLGEENEDEEGQRFLDFGKTVNLKLAGKKPDVSKIKIRAIQKDISGQLGDKSDDEEVFVLVRATLDEVQTKSFRDDNRKVRSKRRLHILEPMSVVKLPEDIAEGLFDQFG